MFSRFSRDVGIDLGTANTFVFVKGKGVVLREPSVVAIRTDTRTVVAIGKAAKRMIGKTPTSVETIRPVRDGVIADYEATIAMIRYFINEAFKSARPLNGRPRVVICVPSGVTAVEKRAVVDAVRQAGAKEAVTIEEPFAAAIGAKLPVWEPTGCMVVDIGGGTTEIAVISLGGIVTSCSIRVAGDKMDDAITQYIKQKYNFIIGEQTAEKIKIDIGSALPLYIEETHTAKGRSLLEGLPATLRVSSREVMEALSGIIDSIVDAVKQTLEGCPPELAADIVERGIVLTGGGGMLRNLGKRLSDEIRIPVIVADRPLDCVAVGTGRALDYKHIFQ